MTFQVFLCIKSGQYSESKTGFKNYLNFFDKNVDHLKTRQGKSVVRLSNTPSYTYFFFAVLWAVYIWLNILCINLNAVILDGTPYYSTDHSEMVSNQLGAPNLQNTDEHLIMHSSILNWKTKIATENKLLCNKCQVYQILE